MSPQSSAPSSRIRRLIMARSIRSLASACVFATFTLAISPGTISPEANAQASYEVTPTIAIPKNHSTWSLFLVCNPAWILQNGDQGIAELFKQYKAFGDAIGPNNLAIWFWKKPGTPTADNTDVSRSSTYCEKYKLLPSESPHVLVTTSYPDDAIPGDHFVVRLNGLDGQDSADALAKLTDQLLVTGLNQSEIDAGDRWRRTLAAVGSAISKTGCYFNKVSFSIKTGALNAEIAHSAESAGPGKGC